MAKKILLADDSITIQKVVELTFAEGDYEVVCASDGAQAIRKIDEIVPDIALVDVMMPQRNGYEVCAHVKKDPSLAWIPVLLLTGTFEPYDPKRSEEVGADGHIIKPFESRALVGQVEELIVSHPRPGTEEEEEKPPIEPAAPAAETAVVSQGQTFAPEEEEEASDDAAPVPGRQPNGPATVRLDSRAFFSQVQPGGEVLESTSAPPVEAATPSLGPLDLGSEGRHVEPTHPVKAPAAEPPGPPPSAEPQAQSAAPSTEGEMFANLPEDVARVSRENVEEMARPIIEKAADRILKEIAWEVIPDLAESIIRRRIRELEEEATSQESAPLH
jgi:CheY-like chemotaxis protein